MPHIILIYNPLKFWFISVKDSMEIYFLVAAIPGPSIHFLIFSFADVNQAEVGSDGKSRKYYFQFRREHFSWIFLFFNKDIILDNNLLS